MSQDFSFPATSEHSTIIGRTGSGKSQLGMWLLSQANFDEMPYVIVDFKGDRLLNSVGAKPVSIYDAPPKEAGIYITKLQPKETDALEDYLYKIHEQGHTGLMFDEGFMVAKVRSLESIYMQGRSLHIPVFTLTQRPSWISRYAFSEASHFAVGHLNDDRDQEKVTHFFRKYNTERTDKFHFQWYNVNEDKNFILRPVEDADTIRSRFEERLTDMKEARNRKFFI